MTVQPYIDLCETLWSDWLGSRLRLPEIVADRFQVDHAPEPYLRFGEGERPLYVLFTNPGVGMPHQHRQRVMAGDSCVKPKMSYEEASRVFARFYCRCLPRGAAQARNAAMFHLKGLLDKDCIVQFESLPFHSGSLPGKAKTPAMVNGTEVLREYACVLAHAMEDISVVALSAVDSSRSISRDSVTSSRWLRWQASLLGVNPERLRRKPLVEKGDGKITSAFLYQHIAGRIRGFVLTMGGNTFPGEKGREALAEVLNSANSQ